MALAADSTKDVTVGDRAGPAEASGVGRGVVPGAALSAGRGFFRFRRTAASGGLALGMRGELAGGRTQTPRTGHPHARLTVGWNSYLL